MMQTLMLCCAGMVRDSHEALHHAAFWPKRGRAQERGIVSTRPRKGQQMGSASLALNKEDSVLVLVREYKCPYCVWPCKGDGAWGCQTQGLQPVCSLLPRAQNS